MAKEHQYGLNYKNSIAYQKIDDHPQSRVLSILNKINVV